MTRKHGRGYVAKTLGHAGVELTVKEWSNRLGLPVMTIYHRLHKGWAIEDVLSTHR